jgi:uncharacterized protein (TIGR03067 family)
MRTGALFCVGVFGLLAMGAGAQNGVDRELKKFQGEWYAVFGEFQGKRVPTKTQADSVFVFKGDKLVNKLSGKADSEARVSLDPSQNPKAIDIRLGDNDRGGFAGIYEFQPDGTLRLALSPRRDGRPTAFPTTPDSVHRLIELKRIRP